MESIAKLKPDFYREIENEAGLKGYIVIDRQINGSATGGIRMAPNVTLDEIANLAHEMTLKYATFKIKKDGAKAGIVASGPDDSPEKRKLCKAFGVEIGDLVREKKYFPGQDLGIDSGDLAEVYSGAGIDALNRSSGIDSGYFTALTVYIAIVEVLYASDLNIKESTFIIEGFGKVGEQLAKLIMKDGAKVCGISTSYGAVFDPGGVDINKICELKKTHGDQLVLHYDKGKEIQKEELILKQADVLIPGARPDSINVHNFDQLKCKIIVPIANIAATEGVEHLLFGEGIIFIPGFVCNAGGILGYYFEEQGFDGKTAERILREGFPGKVKRLIALAREKGKSISEVSRDEALKNITGMRTEKTLPAIQKISPKKLLWEIGRAHV